MNEWHDYEPFLSGESILVQFGSNSCVHCPALTLVLDSVSRLRSFTWVYRDAFACDLAETLEISALPAVLVFHNKDDWTVYQRLRGNDVVSIVEEAFPPRLLFTEDF